MNIPNLIENDISNIKTEVCFGSLDDFISDNQCSLNIEIDFYLDRITSEFSENKYLCKLLDYSSYFIEESFLDNKNVEFVVNGNNVTAVSKINKEDSRKDFVDKILSLMNSLINENVKKVNSSFLLEMEQDAQADLENDYESAIRKIFNSELTLQVSNDDYRIISLSDAMPCRGYDMRQNNYEISSRNSYKLPRPEKNGRDLSKLNSEKNLILSSSFIDEIVEIQRNNPSFISIIAKDGTKEMVHDLLKKSTEQFYSSPRYNVIFEGEQPTFIGRINDGKGNDADIYHSVETYFVTSDCVVLTSKSIKKENFLLFQALGNITLKL